MNTFLVRAGSNSRDAVIKQLLPCGCVEFSEGMRTRIKDLGFSEGVRTRIKDLVTACIQGLKIIDTGITN